ncbi:hypothetical protein JCM8208_002815 [Rhodotorula glutinis]
MPASALAAQVRARTTVSAPFTALASLPGGRTALVGSGRTLALVSLNSHPPSRPSRTWTIFHRDRIHRIVLADPEQASSAPGHRALVVGGKEAVLVNLEHDSDHLEVVQRFHLDDFAGDAAFLDATTLASSPTRPLYSINAPQRPTLWCTRFDRPHYHSARARREEDGIRLAGGSLWGDTFLWDVGTAAALREKAVGAGEGGLREVRTVGEDALQRLAGHKGAVFTVAFSPCARFLVTGSDDRTLRVWNLTLLPPRPPPSTSTSTPPAAAEEHPHLALWGHSARVWRAVFLAPTPVPPRPSPSSSFDPVPDPTCTSANDLDIASVAEDGTARVWRVSPAALEPPAALGSSSAGSGDKGYALVATFRDGHDGRSLWAVEGAECGGSEGEGRRVVLTGGADGAVRCWTVPQSELADSASADGACTGSVPRTRKALKIKAFVAVETVDDEEDDGDLVVVLRDDGSFFAHAAPSMPSATSSSLPLDLAPFHTSPAFAGVSPTCIFRLVPPPCDMSSACRRHLTLLAFSNRGRFLRARLSRAGALLGEVVEADHNVRPALVTTRLEEDGRGRVRVAVWDRAAWEVVLLEVDLSDQLETDAIVVASIVLPADPARAPTALHLLTPSLLLVGTMSGSLELYSAAADGIISLGGRGERYLAHGDGRAILLDHLGHRIYSFDNPFKKAPSQLVVSSRGALRFYRILSDQLHVQSIPTASTFPAPILCPGLHGREIRAIEAIQLQKGRSLVATAAENGVLSVSELGNTTSLAPLWTARNLPSALKALAWSPRSSSSLDALELHTLFVCGAQELLQAYILSSSAPSSFGNGGELNVLSAGQVVGSEGGEVRAMDLAVAAVGAAAEGRHLVAVGYSDGSLRIWAHDARSSTFNLVTRSLEASKCILSVEVIEVELSEVERRWVVVTGASDGLLALRDVTSLIQSSPASRVALLAPPFLAFRPHQSGVNSLVLSSSSTPTPLDLVPRSPVVRLLMPAHTSAECRLLIATGGDDNATSVASLELSTSGGPGDPLCACLVAQATLADAHASSIQGLDFLSPTLLASSSVEQRLNLYSLSRNGSTFNATTTKPELELKLRDSTPLDIADCGAQTVLRRRAGEGSAEDEGERWVVLVAGIGVEVVEVSEALEVE